MNSKRPAVFAALAAAALFGTSGTAQALGPDGTTPITVAGARILIGGIFLSLMLPIAGYKTSEVFTTFRNPRTWIAAVTVIGFQIFYFAGAQYAGVALGALLTMGSMPIFTALIGRFLGHPISLSWVIATLVSVTGLVLLSLDGIESGNALGVTFALIGSIAGAGFALSIKSMFDSGMNGHAGSSAAFLIGGLLMLPLILTQPLNWFTTANGLILVIYLSIIAMAVPNILWLKAIQTLPPGPTSTLMLMEPVMATVLGLVVLNETVNSVGVLGMVLVLTGLAVQGLTLSKK